MSAPVEVEVGDTDVENLALQLTAPAEIRGVVRFEDEEARKLVQPSTSTSQAPQPGSNAQQQKPPLRHVMLRNASSNLTVSGEIKEDGSFTLSQVHPGIYRATIMPRVYVKAMDFGDLHVTNAQLDLRSGAAGVLTVHVATAAGAIGGVIRDDKGPAGGSVVAIVEADAVKASPIFGAVKEDGSYSVTGVAPGKYRIVAYQEGDLLWVNEDIEDIGEPIEIGDRETLTKDLKKRAMPGVK